LLNQGGIGFLENPTARVVFFLFFSTIGKSRKNGPSKFPVHKPITRSKTRARNKVVSEPDMSDQRLEQLESEIHDMQELIQGLSVQIMKEVIQGVSAKIKGVLSKR
jgi:TolA-binding protein